MAGLLLTTQHRREVWGGRGRPPGPEKIGPNFLTGVWPIKKFSGAFGVNRFRSKIFFGASKNSAPPERGGGGGLGAPPPPPPPKRSPGMWSRRFQRISGRGRSGTLLLAVTEA